MGRGRGSLQQETKAVCYLLTLRQCAFLLLLLLLSVVFLLFLSNQSKWQTKGFWEDVRLPSVLREQGEVDKLLLCVNTEDENRECCRPTVTQSQRRV